jgi:hypothetical protein
LPTVAHTSVASVSEGWRAVWDDFRNWLRLGLEARERE